MSGTKPLKRSFLPDDFDAADWSKIAPLIAGLADRPVDTVEQLQLWLGDLSQLDDAIDEYASRKYIDHSCHTDDETIERAYLHVVEQILPKLKPAFFELKRKYLAAPFHKHLKGPRHVELTRQWQNDVDLFRSENVPLKTEDTKLNMEYAKLCGAMVVEFNGGHYTLQQMARFLEEPDRAARQRAWQAIVDRRLHDREAIDDLFDHMLSLRDRIAQNAGHHDYRSYVWQARQRFDYTPEHCRAFADAVAQVCTPLVEQLAETRRRALGTGKTLRPWDLAVDVKNRPPLRPFDAEHIETFVEKTRQMFDRIAPALGQQFGGLRMVDNLDLVSRRGKRPGGYQSSLPVSRQPFIFMNAAGLQRDVETLVHEGGHAFHFLATCDIDLSFVRHAPLEFCEVASMSMELLANDHLGVFYDDENARRAKRQHLEGIIALLPWVATIDSFQHWLYTHAGHTRQQRTERWLALLDRFSSQQVDWRGFDAVRQARWQQQQHLFSAPFYYIEYGIAQLGALQVWLDYCDGPQETLHRLLSAFALGGTVPLPELFETAGIRFDFSRPTLEPLIDAIGRELAALPD